MRNWKSLLSLGAASWMALSGATAIAQSIDSAAPADKEQTRTAPVRKVQNYGPLNAPPSVLPSTLAFQPLPYDEDYTHLGDPGTRSSTWEKLKNIPIGDGFLTIGGELRPRVEVRDHLGFGRGNEDKGVDFQLRSRLWADLHVTEVVRVFGELQSGVTQGLDYAPVAVDQNPIELHQAFVELSHKLPDNGKVLLRLGRQEIAFGKARLFDTRNPPNNRRSYDAARLQITSGPWRFGVLGGAVVADKLGSFNDGTNNGWTFVAAHASRKLGKLLPGAELELLYIHTDRDSAPAAVFVGERDTLSARLAGTAGKFAYDVELVGQHGSIRSTGEQVRAWFVGTDAAWQLPGPLSPRIGLRADIGSGDRLANDGTSNTYDFLWSRGQTYTPELGYSNLISAGPSFGFKPGSRWTAEGVVQGLWRTSKADGLYNLVNVMIRSANQGNSRYVGLRTTARIEYQVDRFLSLGLYVNRTLAGSFLKEAGEGKSLFYSTTYATLRF